VGDDQVSFASAEVPPRAEREAGGPAILDPTRSQRLIDFFEFYPTVTARAINHFARVIKEASRGQSLVGVFYGYGPQYGPIAPETQHLALAPCYSRVTLTSSAAQPCTQTASRRHHQLHVTH